MAKTETWKKLGRVKVSRNAKGQFTTWRKVRPYVRRQTPRQRGARRILRGETVFRGKRVAVYGKTWGKYGIESRRWEVYGSGHELYLAIKNICYRHPPKRRFERIRAVDISPEEESGDEWVDRPEIES